MTRQREGVQMLGQVERSSDCRPSTLHTVVDLAWTYRGERKDVLLRLILYGFTFDTEPTRSIVKRCKRLVESFVKGRVSP